MNWTATEPITEVQLTCPQCSLDWDTELYLGVEDHSCGTEFRFEVMCNRGHKGLLTITGGLNFRYTPR